MNPAGALRQNLESSLEGGGSDAARLTAQLTLAGAGVLAVAFVVQALFELTNRAPRVTDPAFVEYYVSALSLLLGWGLLAVGIYRLRLLGQRADSRVWKAGVSLLTAGLGLATLGYVIVVLAPLLGTTQGAFIGFAGFGLGLIALVSVGSVLVGLTSLRSVTMISRRAAVLVTVSGICVVVGLVLGGLAPVLGAGLVQLVPAVAWGVVGTDLLTASETIRGETSQTTSNATETSE